MAKGKKMKPVEFRLRKYIIIIFNNIKPKVIAIIKLAYLNDESFKVLVSPFLTSTLKL